MIYDRLLEPFEWHRRDKEGWLILVGRDVCLVTKLNLGLHCCSGTVRDTPLNAFPTPSCQIMNITISFSIFLS